MNFYDFIMLFQFAVILVGGLIVYWLFKRSDKYDEEYVKELLEYNIKYTQHVRKLHKDIDRLNRIIKNNEYNTKLDYNKIMYISTEKILDSRDGKIIGRQQLTADITKAKNFVKYNNDYVEVEEDK